MDVPHPPAWHVDPWDSSKLRYWDGTGWTEHTAPAPSLRLPPPYAEVPGTLEPEPGGGPGFWQRRGVLSKLAIVGAAILLGLGALGAILPDPDEDGSLATADAPNLEEPASNEVSTSAAPLAEEAVTSETPPPMTTDAPADSPTPLATAAPVPVAPAVVVTRVVDGDTVEMSDGSTIRLIGIDSPEQGDCGYQEASDTLGMILDGQTVTLVSGARDDIDKYGRLLRYLDLGNGVDANLSMIESGQAIARYDSRDGYGRHTREDAYVAADTASQAFCSTPDPAVAPPPPPPPLPMAAIPVAPAAPTNVSYANCDAVRAAGAAPIRPGDPGFQQKFDRDNDGVGCE